MKEQNRSRKGKREKKKSKIPKGYELEGVRISKMTQKLAYEYIIDIKKLKLITKEGKRNIEEMKKRNWRNIKNLPHRKGNMQRL